LSLPLSLILYFYIYFYIYFSIHRSHCLYAVRWISGLGMWSLASHQGIAPDGTRCVPLVLYLFHHSSRSILRLVCRVRTSAHGRSPRPALWDMLKLSILPPLHNRTCRSDRKAEANVSKDGHLRILQSNVGFLGSEAETELKK
jgi:hypothetical protein